MRVLLALSESKAAPVDQYGWPTRFRLRRTRPERPFRDLGRCVTGAFGLRRLR